MATSEGAFHPVTGGLIKALPGGSPQRLLASHVEVTDGLAEEPPAPASSRLVLVPLKGPLWLGSGGSFLQVLQQSRFQHDFLVHSEALEMILTGVCVFCMVWKQVLKSLPLKKNRARLVDGLEVCAQASHARDLF